MKIFLNSNGKLVLAVLSFLGISLYYAIGNKIFPSLDGPSHWNNANLLKQYFLGNEVVKQNFELNTFYIPNIFSQYLLAFLMLFCKSTLAMIIFQVIHYMSFFMGVLYFLNAYNVKYSYFLSLISVLFFNSFLLNIGFYNFSFSVIFLVIAMGYYHKQFSSSSSLSIPNYIILFLLLALLFYSNALSLLVFFLFVAVNECIKFYLHVRAKIALKAFILKELKLCSVCMPFVIMIFMFEAKFPFQNPPMFSNDIPKYFTDLHSLTPFIVYNVANETPFVQWIGYFISIWLFCSIIWRIAKRKNGFDHSDIMLVILLIVLGLYLVIPNMYSVGMMSSRFLYFFFFFLIIWLLLQDTKWIKLILVIGIIVTVFFERDRRHIHALNFLNKNLKLVEQASIHIKENSVVLPLCFSDNWIERHFAHYMAADKALILLDNYEANVRWFPLKWRLSTMPKYLLGQNETVEGIYDCLNKQGISKPIDYVFIYGDRSHISKSPQLLAILEDYYKKILTAENGLCTVYKLKTIDH